MRSLVPLLLIFLACGLAGCGANHASPDTASTAGRTFVALTPLGGAGDALHESCGGR